MPDELLAELEQFAEKLIDAEQSLFDVLRRKRAALTSADLDTMAALQAPETEAARRLQELVSWRAGILARALQTGHRCESLTGLVQTLPVEKTGKLRALLKSAQRLARAVREESWTQWVITNRCCNFYGEVLELIAHGGRKSPTYDERSWSHHGGAVLDANA